MWGLTSSRIVLAAMLLPVGTLADRFGRIRTMRIGLIVFVAASCAAAAGPSDSAVIAAKFAQGAAGAFVLPAALARFEHRPVPSRDAGRPEEARRLHGSVLDSYTWSACK